MADKNLDGNGLSEVWVRAAQLVKKYTGAVDLTKGDLQTQVNGKLSGTDDTKDNTVTFTSADETNPTAWKDVAALASNEKHSSILNKISNMFSNIRYLYKNVGGIKGLSSSSAITTQGEYALDAREKNASVDGTLANQISTLNSNLGGSWTNVTDNCNWYVTRHSASRIFINYDLKIVFCYMAINQNVSNQQDIVSIGGLPEIKFIRIMGIGVSETSGVSIDIASNSNTLKSSHSVAIAASQPRYIVIGFYTT